MYIYIYIHIFIFFSEAFFEVDKASEEKRNICNFKKIMCFFSSFIFK